ncbi:hypothetical protein DFP72DRAFT_1065478 [Ephemerocybe angulata]|uniref:Uncharacterized protein n=1 Tax=Ephemerocybe angulata TaxID=980116 RepID=A0A8H6MA47_9AGAR|nr:hypothetical protein DFP72DRAFT_1065478 [Tulosesus angulatus]
MSSSHSYGTWSGLRNGSGRTHPPVERRSSDGEQSAYSTINPYMNESYMANMADELRPPSSNSSLTSSLTGAMGDNSLSNPSRSSRSPPSTAIFSGALPSQDLSWTNNQMNMAMSNTTYSSHANLGFSNMGTPPVNTMPFNDYTRNPSPPESIAPPSPPYPQAFADQFSRNQMGMSSRSTVGYSGSSMPTSYSPDATMSSEGASAQQEMRRLRRRVQELEMELNRSRAAIDTLRSNVPNSNTLPTPPHSSSFQSGWKARTEARKKLFCSLNRAGNALCAWHDSRRERRAFPPRNAPPGYLNCGCTYNEALFEESLSRHGVGSYHPGETVRMDPALRNPLLKLLESRYGIQGRGLRARPHH